MAEEAFVFPLSFAQQRLWFLDQLLPGTSLYNVPTTLRLCGPLDQAALAKSLNEIVRRHEILRTTFVSNHGQPLQVVSPIRSQPLLIIDLRALPASERIAAALRLAINEANQPFALTHDRLLRTSLLWLDEHEHWLLLTTHHIVSDGWSLSILLDELSTLYTAFRAGQPSPLPVLPIQYADFVIWQRSWLQGKVLAEQLSYWARKLADTPTLELPTDYPRPDISSFRGNLHSFALPVPLYAKLKALSQQEGVTLFMTLLAVWQTLLYRYTGQHDIVVGSPIAGRTHTEIEGLIGFFVNTLVLRTQINGRIYFRELLHQVRETALQAYAHQHLPFEMLVEELQPHRDISRNPLFQVTFQLQDDSVSSKLDLPELALSFPKLPSLTAKFDLALEVWAGSQQLRAVLKYSTDLFEETTIQRMAQQFEQLVAGIVARPDHRLADLPLLTPHEQRLLVVRAVEPVAPVTDCVHHLIEAQAEYTPGAPAVEFLDERLTYSELNAQANVLMHHLRTCGVGPEVLVGLCMSHTPLALVGLLAILKAGGAYVPLDPLSPPDRLRFIIEDAHLKVVLTEAQFSDLFPPAGPPLILLDRNWDRFVPERYANLSSNVQSNNAAYVIYTSGSTGQPKGVLVDHRSTVNYLRWVNQVLGDEPVDLPAVTKLTFDASLKQLLAPLVRGGSVWLLPDEVLKQPAALLAELSTRAHVGFNGVPVLWQAMLDVLEKGASPPRGFTTLLLGGDQFTPELITRTYAALPSATIWNLYGPTEATANASAALIAPRAPITIGRPIPNTQMYVLDAALQPSPIGVVGELYIGGAGLARGYLGRPSLTAECFVPHPFSDVPGARLYRTGDCVQYRLDGSIEFLGRIDQQVKIDGVRIELGEIEAVLCQHPAVRAAVVVSDDRAGHTRLVAFIVPREPEHQHPATSVDLRQYLRQKLPAYMVPAGLVMRPALPLNVHGKIDRRACVQLIEQQLLTTAPDAAPHTALERAIVEVWQAVLHIEQVGLHDNFFDLGGRSLLLVEVHSKLQSRLPQPVTLIDLFRYPTVQALATFVSQAQNGLATCDDIQARAQKHNAMIGRRARPRHEGMTREQLDP